MKILKFGAVWCPGCLVMKPRFLEIEKELPWLQTVYYEYDDEKEMVEKWKVNQTLPVFIFVDKNDIEITRVVGEHSKKKILELIEMYKDK